MYINAAILTYLTEQRNKALADFNAHQPLLIRLLDELRVVNTDQVKQGFYDELVANCQNRWSKASGLMRGILFEYDYIFRENPDAAAYGIVFGNFQAQAEPFGFGDFTEFADGFEALPGVTLNLFNPLIALERERFEPRSPSDIDEATGNPRGYTELIRAYVLTAFICLHHALAGFTRTSAYEALNRRSPFYFLIDEHDTGEAYPIYVTG